MLGIHPIARKIFIHKIVGGMALKQKKKKKKEIKHEQRYLLEIL